MGKVVLFLALFVLVACQHAGGSFCSIAKPIRPTKETVSVLTDAEVAAILSHNKKGSKLCGWKP